MRVIAYLYHMEFVMKEFGGKVVCSGVPYPVEIEVSYGSPLDGEFYKCTRVVMTKEQEIIDKLRGLLYKLIDEFVKQTGYKKHDVKVMFKIASEYYDIYNAHTQVFDKEIKVENIVIPKSYADADLETLSRLFNQSFKYAKQVINTEAFEKEYEQIKGRPLYEEE